MRDQIEIGINGETVVVFTDSDLLEGSVLGGVDIGDNVHIAAACRLYCTERGAELEIDSPIEVSITGRMDEDGQPLDDVGPVKLDPRIDPEFELMASAILTAIRAAGDGSEQFDSVSDARRAYFNHFIRNR